MRNAATEPHSGHCSERTPFHLGVRIGQPRINPCPFPVFPRLPGNSYKQVPVSAVEENPSSTAWWPPQVAATRNLQILGRTWKWQTS